MKLNFCVVCGNKDNLHHHHIIPKSDGGNDNDHNFLTFCWEHHDFIHDIRKTRNKENFSQLVKQGQLRSGNFGGRPKVPKEKEIEVCKLWNNGRSFRQISRETGVSVGTVQRISKDYDLTPKPQPPKKYKKTNSGQYKLF